MASHVAILHKQYIRMVLDGEKTIESRMTKSNRAPYQCIEPGERIYFKASSGPFMATAVASRIDYHEDLQPSDVKHLKERWNHRIGGDEEYWRLKTDSRFATFAHLRDVEPINFGPPVKSSRGIAWFVLDDADNPICDVTLSAGAVRNRWVRINSSQKKQFPADSFGSDRKRGSSIQLIMPDGEKIETDFVKGLQLRWRGWKPYFEQSRAAAGDTVRFIRDLERVYLVEMRPKWHVPPINHFASPDWIDHLIRLAMTEDLGEIGRDITSNLAVPESKRSEALIRARKSGRLSGAAMLESIARIYDKRITVRDALPDGFPLTQGDVIAQVTGPLRSILQFERVALNFLTHLSGIATLTAKYVNTVDNKRAQIYDTRKTTPGLRGLEKYAVRCGGGKNHRTGLYDAVLVKDNHLADVPPEELNDEIVQLIERARRADPPPKFIEVEVDTLKQFKEMLTTDADLILLDNMTLVQLNKAVALRNKYAPYIELEASGGINLKTVRKVAETGVDRIAIGALTHSAPALDIGMDIA